MIFRANSLQPVAGATGVSSRVQLPTAGRIAMSLFGAGNSRALPARPDAARHDPPRGHLAQQQQTQYRAQCRANCMSKANF